VSCNTLLGRCRLSWPLSCCLDGPTPFFLSLREVGLLISAFGSSRSASSAYQKWPTRHTCICDALSPRQAHLSPIQSLRRGKGRSDPTTSNHSLYLMKLPAGRRPSRLSLSLSLGKSSSPRRLGLANKKQERRAVPPAGRVRACYPGGNFKGNQLLDGSISLSPLYPGSTIDLHVRIAASFHQGFPWLHPTQA
jgi:hypothetical protein